MEESHTLLLVNVGFLIASFFHQSALSRKNLATNAIQESGFACQSVSNSIAEVSDTTVEEQKALQPIRKVVVYPFGRAGEQKYGGGSSTMFYFFRL